MSIILAGSYAATLMVDPFIDDRVSANFVVYVDHSPLEQSEQIYASMTPGIQTPELVISAPSTLPVYLPEDELYGTQAGPVYVLTHECDTDRNNQRIFNDRLLICPIIELSSFVRIYSQVDEGKLRNFLVALGRREVYRVIYLPHYSPYLPYGGLLYFNFIANSAPSAFQRNPLATVTYYGLNIIDQAVRNHLLRPKNASLPLEHY